MTSKHPRNAPHPTPTRARPRSPITIGDRFCSRLIVYDHFVWYTAVFLFCIESALGGLGFFELAPGRDRSVGD
jgi:hypothetical protein